MSIPIPNLSIVGAYAQAMNPLEDGQRVDNFARLRSRGVNVLITNEQTDDRAAWVAAAKRAGLRYFPKPVFAPGGDFETMRLPLDAAQLRADDADPDCLGWALPDEYDRTNKPVENLAAVCQAIRAASAKPIFLNFTGQSPGLGGLPGTAARVKPLADAVDLIGWDFYLYATRRTPFAVDGDPTKGYGIVWIGLLEKVAALTGNKPQVVFVDSSRQLADPADPPGPTAAQYEEMVAVVAGYARGKGINLAGICLFPQRRGNGANWRFDATPPDVAAVMPAVHARYLPASVPPDPVAALQGRVGALEGALASARADAAAARGEAAAASAAASAARDYAQQLAAWVKAAPQMGAPPAATPVTRA
jgi:hypothetical protein